MSAGVFVLGFGDRQAGGLCPEALGEAARRPAIATANVTYGHAWRRKTEVCGDEFDQVHLGGVGGFPALVPETVVDVLSPQRSVEGVEVVVGSRARLVG